MNKPTITDVCNLIHAYERLDPIDRGVHALALKIHWLYNPTLKPLSDLHKDREACEKIFEFVTMQRGIFEKIEQNKLHISLLGVCSSLYSDITFPVDFKIYPNGRMRLISNGEEENVANQFTLVKLILSLGYDVQPETKTT